MATPFVQNAMFKKKRQAVQNAATRFPMECFDGYFDEGGLMASCHLTGIENMITPCIEETSRKCALDCVNSVLDEQSRQRRLGRCNPDLLAQISRESSAWAMERAEKIGLYQSKPDC